MKNKKIGFIGCGKMGSALIDGLIASGACPGENIVATDIAREMLEKVATATGFRTAETGAAVVEASEIIMLCVKPNDAVCALESMRPQLAGKLLVSIAAGVTINTLQQAAGPDARVVRVMPNTPALIHRGAAGYSMGKTATQEDAAVVERIFRAVGRIFHVKEEQLDVVTGLSGSGPAYIYMVIEAMADAGVLMGLPRDLALQLSAQTVSGAAEMVLRTGHHPAQLKDMVTSPGGTTIAGLETLEQAGVRSAFLKAVRAATERSRELGGK
jgi:pyrroline-5-carboxylate reductase